MRVRKPADLSGRRFGRWIVLFYCKPRRWVCRCDCGTERPVDGSSLRSGRSMGCIKCNPSLGNRRTHGATGTRLFRSWEAMKRRCLNPSDRAFARYGGRGIKVCPEWLGGFEPFQAWALANGYAAHLTIERRDNDGDYTPDNCRWATYAEQSRNNSRNRPITYQGRLILAPDLAKEVGLPGDVLKNRIFRYGWPVERAVSTPVQSRLKRQPWAALGLSRSSYYRKVAVGALPTLRSKT